MIYDLLIIFYSLYISSLPTQSKKVVITNLVLNIRYFRASLVIPTATYDPVYCNISFGIKNCILGIR